MHWLLLSKKPELKLEGHWLSYWILARILVGKEGQGRHRKLVSWNSMQAGKGREKDGSAVCRCHSGPDKKIKASNEPEGRRRRRQQSRRWMASPTQWRWVWVNSESWWWRGKSGMLQSMGSQRVGHDWASELNEPEWLPGEAGKVDLRCAHTYTRTGPGCIGLVVHSCFMFIEDLLWPKMNKGWFKHVSASTLFRTNVQKNPRDNRHFLIREIRPKERRPIIRGLSSFSSFLCSTQNHHLNGKLRTDLVRRELNPKMGKEIVASTWIL